MKLLLPHREVDLDMKLETEERLELIEELLQERIGFHDKTMTVEEYFNLTFQKENTKVSLDIISYYLTKQPKNLEVLSKVKVQEMQKGSKRHVTFSGMGYENQIAYGVIDKDDYTY